MEFLGKKQVFIIAVIIGLIFPLFAWIIELSQAGLSFNIQALILIHRENSSLIMFSLIPLIFITLAYLLYRFLNYYEPSFAEQIGNGDMILILK
jgi:carbon starvation protein CstA